MLAESLRSGTRCWKRKRISYGHLPPNFATPTLANWFGPINFVFQQVIFRYFMPSYSSKQTRSTRVSVKESMAGLPGEQEDWAIIRRANEEKRIAANQKFALAALDSVEQKLGIQQVPFRNSFNLHSSCDIIQPDDWLTITLIEAWEVGLPKTVKGTSQLVELLKQRYPDRNWDKMFIIKGRFGQQRRLVQAVSALFPVMPSLTTILKLTDLKGDEGDYQREKRSRGHQPCNWPCS